MRTDVVIRVGARVRAVCWAIAISFVINQVCSVGSVPSIPFIKHEQLMAEDILEDQESSGDLISDKLCVSFLASGDGIGSTMENLAKLEITEKTVETVITQTRRAVAESGDLGVLEVTQAVSIIEHATELASLPEHTAQEVLDIVDTLTTLNVTGLDLTTTHGNIPNRLISSVGEVGRKVKLDSSASAQLATSTTGVRVWDISKALEKDALPIGVSLKSKQEQEEKKVWEGKNSGLELVVVVEDDGEVAPYTEDTDAAIALTPSFLKDMVRANPGKEVRMWMTVFSDPSLFHQHQYLAIQQNLSQSRGHLKSKVISASVAVNGDIITQFQSSVVTSVFLPLVGVPNDRRAQLSRCVFWDLQVNEGRGGWSQQGCRYRTAQHGRDVCVCDHLTNFAVLLDLYGESEQQDKGHQIALSLISVVGLSVSIFGLSCIIVAFIFIKKMHTVLPKQVLFNLALAMLLSWTVFLAGFSRGSGGSDVACIGVAALLHYFILATFLWMLAEGAMQYMLLVKVHGQVRRFLLKAALFAWGTPVIPVLTILAVDLKLYRGYDNYCWMSITPLYFGFLLPVGLVMLCNLIIYVLVVVSICRVRGRTKAGGRSKSGRGDSIRASFACFVVLGLSWFFAFLAVENARLVFQYLFTATTTFQGLLLFLAFTARDPLVQDFCKDKLRQGMALVRSSAGRSQTRSSSTSNANRGREDAAVHQKSVTTSSTGKRASGFLGTSTGGQEVGVQMEILPNALCEKKSDDCFNISTRGQDIRVHM